MLTNRQITKSIEFVGRYGRQGPIKPASTFKWIAANGDRISPKDMTTMRLFYIMRMIWNNTHPQNERVGQVRLYTFNPEVYTQEYMQEAINEIGSELLTRTDLPEHAARQLFEMASHALFRKIK